jgi:hypothetical protein
MKSFFIIIFLLQTALCFAQTGRDTLSKPVKDSVQNKKGIIEKQDISTLKTNKFLLENKVYSNPADAEYSTNLKKASLKEMVSKGLSSDQVNVENNAKNILNDINKSMEDKRSNFQKIMQTALGAVQTAVVVGLAVREVVKENKKD